VQDCVVLASHGTQCAVAPEYRCPERERLPWNRRRCWRRGSVRSVALRQGRKNFPGRWWSKRCQSRTLRQRNWDRRRRRELRRLPGDRFVEKVLTAAERATDLHLQR